MELAFNKSVEYADLSSGHDACYAGAALFRHDIKIGIE